MGDAAGVGPEVIMKALGHREVYGMCRPLVVGDARRLARAGGIVGTRLAVRSVGAPGEAGFEHGTVDCLDLALVPPQTPFGPTSLHIEDQGKTLEQPLSVIDFSLEADKLTLIRGESTQGRAVIRGADQNLAGGIVRIHNLSTEIIALSLAGTGPAVQLERRIEPGMIQNGQVVIPFTIRSHRGGGFRIVGGAFDPRTMGAAGCSCGCGGTPRPACAHSCGGDPCTGGSQRRK